MRDLSLARYIRVKYAFVYFVLRYCDETDTFSVEIVTDSESTWVLAAIFREKLFQSREVAFKWIDGDSISGLKFFLIFMMVL